jgi:hypothetical protein
MHFWSKNFLGMAGLSLILTSGAARTNDQMVIDALQKQDAPFHFHSGFASDGTNQPGLSSDERNFLVLEEIWDSYVSARAQILKPIPEAYASGNSRAEMDRALTVLRYGHLLDTMLQLRAFAAQNKGFADEVQRDEVARFDGVLRAYRLYYYPNCGQAMVDFCDKIGPDQIRRGLMSILNNDDKTLRPIPQR